MKSKDERVTKNPIKQTISIESSNHESSLIIFRYQGINKKQVYGQLLSTSSQKNWWQFVWKKSLQEANENHIHSDSMYHNSLEIEEQKNLMIILLKKSTRIYKSRPSALRHITQLRTMTDCMCLLSTYHSSPISKGMKI